MKRVAFTGTREQLTFEQATALRFWLEARAGELHHGDCIGADDFAHQVAWSLRGWRTVLHPASGVGNLRAGNIGDEVRDPKPPLVRNADIVAETAELLAAPDGPERQRSGTWSTVRKARALGRPVTIVWPDGTVEVEGSKTAGAA